MENGERSSVKGKWKDLLLQRLLDFSVDIINLTNELPKTPAGFAIASQVIRSGTSIGANVEEAQDASSKKDFIHKLSIALRESKETKYWLLIIQRAKLIEGLIIEKNILECQEIISILVKSIKSAKYNENKK